ncbi:hypothetical protein [Polynucleobacter sp. AP-Nino-20-G2]|uniref:hypothetical protein n=1 Tax=Polynucleobacter sp. AP-Nino-20-G2 TaxID=2576917 RepID=UPI001BFD6934|nr:hypothetical protein [Polynucleobacter sp. AP-Nino-20-G2]QWE17166.1 hypothetical protein FD960_02795 [Polynucleobacter sp. AP-Nino-20-G2]
MENMLTTRISSPLNQRASKKMRGAVNEVAFRAFSRIRHSKITPDRTNVQKAISESIEEAIGYVNRFISDAKNTISEFDENCIRESTFLAFRLLHFFPNKGSLTIQPAFVGCGLISACEGDVIVDNCLYEIKAGDRAFRISDLRQLLIYTALAYSNRSLTFNYIGLFNPRTGVTWRRSIDHVCLAVAGQRANDVLPILVDHFSMASVSR